MPSTINSTEYGQQMGDGWSKGLSHKYNNNISVFLETKVMRNKKEIAGDIDVAIYHSEKPLCLYKDLFPIGHTKLRPGYLEYSSSKSKTFLAEIKRSIKDHITAETYVERFVEFYSDLLDDNSKLRIQLLPNDIQAIIRNKNTKLLFVFNGFDYICIQQKMQQEIFKKTHQNIMKIHGRDVVCVWCNAPELIKWQDMMKMEEMEKELKRRKKNERDLRAVLKREREKDKILQAENEALKKQLNELQSKKARNK